MPTNDYMEKQHEQSKSLDEQVANHTSRISELNKSISSISSDIKGLQQQATSLDTTLSKLADNQATLLSMTAGKPQAHPTVGMNSISIKETLPTTFEETYNELLNYTDILEPLLLQFGSLTEEEREEIMRVEEETIMAIEENDYETKQVEEIKMLSDTITEPLLDLDKCSLHELMSILQNIAKDPSINVHQAGFGSYITNHVLKEKIDRYNR